MMKIIFSSLIVLGIIVYIASLDINDEAYGKVYDKVVLGCSALLASSIILGLAIAEKLNENKIKPHTYFLEAEVAVANEDTTIFTTEQGYYKANGFYSDDNVYLLTMQNNGKEEDIILVVWECAN